MTLTVKVKFRTNKSLEEVFGIAQKVVKTPDGIQPIVDDNSISNPPMVGAAALMWAKKDIYGQTIVYFDQPYSNCQTMPDLIAELICELELDSYSVYDEMAGKWHKNSFQFL